MSEERREGRPQQHYCRSCGAEARPGTVYCVSCGARLAPEADQTGAEASISSG